MNDESMGVEQSFYLAVAEKLQCDGHIYRQFPFRRRTRWNNRTAGNGRYPGHGLVRYFGPSHIDVRLNHPPVSGVYCSTELALAAIQTALQAVQSSSG